MKYTVTHIPSFMGLYLLLIVVSNVAMKAAWFFCSKRSESLADHGCGNTESTRNKVTEQKMIAHQMQNWALQPHQEHRSPDTAKTQKYFAALYSGCDVTPKSTPKLI